MTASASQSAEPTPRRGLWPGIAGLVAGGLLIAGYALAWRMPDIEEKDAVRKVVAFYRKDSNQALSETQVLLLLAAALLFMFFLVALSRRAGNRSHLVLVGGTVFTVFLMVSALAGNTFGITASHSEAFQVGPQTALIAILLMDIAYGATIAAMTGAAVMLFALWRVSRDTGAVPVRLGWFGLVVAVLSLAGPFSAWFTPLLLAVWMIAAGVILIARARGAREVSDGAAGGHHR
ncbi:hypothetical protein NLX86_00365 [Streptomyces sp. A3M-1-3]|uniref:hypothetical protein n=1 Tax=Streptomyces sp. A3M-1-3 TaxID=2962044 RepID=UPI0020B8FD53|nr:hypothetical protein [Streptomyces sp. A3M-1-3]MCP3816644.1 hypothetical protein [Streptomyces sp. A3M-1-3]